jgi:hypothetical protein
MPTFNISKIVINDERILIYQGKINYAFPNLEYVKERAERINPKQMDLGIQAAAQDLMISFIITIPPKASVVARAAIYTVLSNIINRDVVF